MVLWFALDLQPWLFAICADEDFARVLGGPGQDIEPTHRGGRFRDHHSLNAHCGLAPDQRADGDPRGHLPTAVHRFPDNPAGSHGIGGRGCAWRHRRILFSGTLPAELPIVVSAIALLGIATAGTPWARSQTGKPPNYSGPTR